MFERFALASNYDSIQKRFDMASLPEGEEYSPSFNIALGGSAYVVVSELNVQSSQLNIAPRLRSYFEESKPTKAIRSFRFGLQGVEKEKKYFIRAEGDRNLNNDSNYTGAKAIFLKPKYKRIIREQRCLVLADAFIVGLEHKPYLVYMRNKKRPFAFAGVWNTVIDENSGEQVRTFAILTVVANPLIKRLGFDRMPVIIREQHERRWLSSSSGLWQTLDMLSPYPHHLMNAYPVSEKIRDLNNNDVSTIQPIGKRIFYEDVTPLSRKAVRVKRNYGNSMTMGEVAAMGRK